MSLEPFLLRLLTEQKDVGSGARCPAPGPPGLWFQPCREGLEHAEVPEAAACLSRWARPHQADRAQPAGGSDVRGMCVAVPTQGGVDHVAGSRL